MEVITAARQAATQSGAVITLGAGILGSIEIGQGVALAVNENLTTGASLDGTVIKVRVQTEDTSVNTAFMIIEGTYSGTNDTITRTATRVSQTSGGTTATSDISIAGNLIVIGVIDDLYVHPNDVRTVQKASAVTGDLGTLTVDHTTATPVAGHTTSFTVVPTYATTSLDVKWFGDALTEASASSSSSRSITRLYYKNSSDVWTAIGDAKTSGEGSDAASDANAGLNFGFSSGYHMTQSHFNSAGSWELKIYIYTTADTNTNVTLLSGNFSADEYV